MILFAILFVAFCILFALPAMLIGRLVERLWNRPR